MGKLGPTLIKSCEANLIDMSLVIFFSYFFIKIREQIRRKNFFRPYITSYKCFWFLDVFLGHTVYEPKRRNQSYLS